MPIEGRLALEEGFKDGHATLDAAVRLVGIYPDSAVAGIAIGEDTYATKRIHGGRAIFHIPHGRLKKGPNTISAFIRTEESGWKPATTVTLLEVMDALVTVTM